MVNPPTAMPSPSWGCINHQSCKCICKNFPQRPKTEVLSSFPEQNPTLNSDWIDTCSKYEKLLKSLTYCVFFNRNLAGNPDRFCMNNGWQKLERGLRSVYKLLIWSHPSPFCCFLCQILHLSPAKLFSLTPRFLFSHIYHTFINCDNLSRLFCT